MTQVDRFLESSGDPNNRPIQPLGDRVIFSLVECQGCRAVIPTFSLSNQCYVCWLANE